MNFDIGHVRYPIKRETGNALLLTKHRDRDFPIRRQQLGKVCDVETLSIF